MIAPLLLAFAPVAAPCAAATPLPADAPVLQLVSDFVAAEQRFDQARLAELTTPDYAEVSPLGALDRRDAFLGFYAPELKRPAPVPSICDPYVRRYDGAASVVARLALDLPGREGQPARTIAFRASFLAVRQSGGWKLASAQYTPLREAPAPN